MNSRSAALAVLAAGITVLTGAAAPGAAFASVTRPSATSAARVLPPQQNVPSMDAPGQAQIVTYPPDAQIRQHYSYVSIQAPQYTRIIAVNLNCDFSCPVTIAPDGRSAQGPMRSDNWIFTRPFTVTLMADDNAPLQGGQFSGSFTLDGMTRPLTVTITPGTPGSVSMFPVNNPSGGVSAAYVLPGSNADASGLQTGDVITAVDNRPTPDVAAFNSELAGLRSGATIPVTINRNGQTMAIDMTLD